MATLYKNASEENQAEPNIAKEILKPDVEKILNGPLSEKTEGAINIGALLMPGTQEEKAATIVEKEGLFYRAPAAKLNVNLEEIAQEIHSKLSPETQKRNTTGAAKVLNSKGYLEVWVSSNEIHLRPAARAALKDGQKAVSGKGHAEVTILNAAKENGAHVIGVAASRPICENCAAALKEARAEPASRLKKVK